MFELIDSLEPRRLLSLNSFTPIRMEDGANFATAISDSGSFLIARLVHESTPNQFTLKVQRFATTGSPVGSELTLDAHVASTDLAVAMDAKGNGVVVYGSTAGQSAGVLFRTISSDGVVSKRISTGLAAGLGSGQVAVSMDAKGEFFVDSAGQVRGFNATGAPRHAPFTAISGFNFINGGTHRIAIKPDGSGAFVLAGERYHSRVVEVSTVKVIRTVRQDDSNSDGNYAVVEDVAAKANGDPLLAVQTYHDFNEEQNLVGSIEIGAAVLPTNPVIDMLPDGGFIAAYVSTDLDLTTGNTSVAVERHHADGTLDGVVQVSPSVTGGIGQFMPEIATAANGTIFVAWTPTGGPPLSYRRLTTNFTAIDRGELYVFGESKAELLSVRQSAGKIIATRSKTDKSYEASLVQSLTMNGYEGDDNIVNDTNLPCTIDGGDGQDTITSFGISNEIHGGDGNDQIAVAGNSAAHLFGGKGNDILRSGAGKQFFDGESGDDTIYGGDGNDRITGGEGNDRLIGGGGDDLINAGAGNDYIDAGKDNDVIYANDGQVDTLFGGGGDDSAQVDKNVDLLDGIESVA